MIIIIIIYCIYIAQLQKYFSSTDFFKSKIRPIYTETEADKAELTDKYKE